MTPTYRPMKWRLTERVLSEVHHFSKTSQLVQWLTTPDLGEGSTIVRIELVQAEDLPSHVGFFGEPLLEPILVHATFEDEALTALVTMLRR